MSTFSIDDIVFDSDNPLFLIAGPCVIESLDHSLYMADTIKKITEKFGIPYIFKSSFLKANRSSINSYMGPGLEEGLKVLEKVNLENRCSDSE